MVTQLIPPPPPDAPDLSDITSGAGTLVKNGWTQAQLYASNAVAAANTFLNNVTTQSAALTSLPILEDAIGAVSKTIGAYVAPVPPATPTDMAFVAPSAPVEPTFTPIAALDTGTAPVFDVDMPDINLPATSPTPLTAVPPTAPTLDDIAIPASPTLVLPAVPTLTDIVVPTAPLLSLPSFTAVMPNTPAAAAYTFNFAETAYSSTLLSALRARLQEWVDGAATGLSAAVENAIWDRGRGREVVQAGMKIKSVVRDFAMRGFAKPPGAMSIQIADASQEAATAISTINRDIMIKQADLEQSNRRFAFEEAFKVESELITYANQMSQRAFDTARYAQEAAIDIYRVKVSQYTADIQAYSAKVEQYKAALQAELTKLEVYRSQLEGVKVISQINTQMIDIYRTKVEAARAVIEIFRAQVDAVNAQASINRTQIESYAAQVNAYGEIVRAKASEYDAYATRVRAEVSKADIYTSQVAAYSSQVVSFKSMIDARVAAKDMEIKIGRTVPVDLFKIRSEVFKTQNDAEAARVAVVADVFGKNVQAYGSKISGETGRMNAESTAYNSEVNYRRAEADVRIDVAKSNIEKMKESIAMLIQAAESGAQTQAQLAASALSSVNLSGSISDSAGVSLTSGYNTSVGYNFAQSAATSESATTSTVNSTSNTTSTSNNTNTNYNSTT